MQEMDEGQKKTARRVSAEFARFWRIFNRPRRSSVEDVIWANQYFEDNINNYRDLIALTPDEDERAVLEIVFLGLYHLGYEFPVEFKYQRPNLN